MKKILLAIAAVLMCMGLLTGCAMLSPDLNLGGGPEGPGGTVTEKTPLEIVAEKYGKLSEATVIAQNIGISQGSLVQFSSEKTFTKRGSGYQVSGKEIRLNSLASGEEEPYTETPIEETVKEGQFSVRLVLDELYFSTAPVFQDGVMEAGVSDGSVRTVFGISEDLPAPVHGMTLKIATDETHVTGMEIAYGTGSSTVNIVLKFTY